jgi:polar amino acid transport system substrate-binding protein
MVQTKSLTKLLVCATAITVVLFGFYTVSNARDLKASVAQIPVLAETPEKGAFIDFLKALDEVYTDGKIIIELYPWPRSLANVINGTADFQMPMISDPRVDMDTMPYRFCSLPMGTVSVVLYSNINKKITKQMILDAAKQKPFPFIVELTRGTESFYDFPTGQSVELSTSFNKLELGRIDAFLVAQEDGDIICKNLKLKKLRRDLWESKDDLLTIQKGPKGDEVDKILCEGIKKLMQSGKMKEIRAKIHVPYVDWQPYQTTY